MRFFPKGAAALTVLIGFAAAILIAVPSLSGAEQAAGPRIAVNELRYHAGKVEEGSLVSHIFEVRNAGSGTLVIERVQPG